MLTVDMCRWYKEQGLEQSGSGGTICRSKKDGTIIDPKIWYYHPTLKEQLAFLVGKTKDKFGKMDYCCSLYYDTIENEEGHWICGAGNHDEHPIYDEFTDPDPQIAVFKLHYYIKENKEWNHSDE